MLATKIFWMKQAVKTAVKEKFSKDERGQGMVEYGLIIALVALAVIGGLTFLGGGLDDLFNKINGELTTTP